MSPITTCFIICYVPFVACITIVASTVLEVASRGVVAAATADAGDQRRTAVFDYMLLIAIGFMVLFWFVVGLAFYRYAESWATATELDDTKLQQQQQQQQQQPVSTAPAAKRKSVILLLALQKRIIYFPGRERFFTRFSSASCV